MGQFEDLSSDEEIQKGDGDVIRNYENERKYQVQRMQRRARMQLLENPKYTNIQEIRNQIDEINKSREFKRIQKADTTQVLQPVYESVQSIIGKQNAKEIKTFTGKETVRIDDPCLVDIPRVEDQVNYPTFIFFFFRTKFISQLMECILWEQREGKSCINLMKQKTSYLFWICQTQTYRILKANMKTHTNLLLPGRIANQITALETKSAKLTSILAKVQPGSGTTPQAANEEKVTEKKQSVKHISIINRIMQSEKLFQKSKLIGACETHTDKLKKKKDRILEEYENAARLRKLQASHATAVPATPIAAQTQQYTQGTGQNTAQTPLKNSNSNSNFLQATNHRYSPRSHSIPVNNSTSTEAFFLGQSPSSNMTKDFIPTPNALKQKGILRKADESSPMTLDNHNNHKSFSGRIQQLASQQQQQQSQYQSQSHQPTLLKNDISIEADSIESLSSLDSFLQTQRSSSQDLDVANRGRNQSSKAAPSRTRTKKLIENNEDSSNQIVDENNPNSILNLLRPKKEKEKLFRSSHYKIITEADPSMNEHIESMKKRFNRLKNVKRKLGLLDQATVKQDQLQAVAKELQKIAESQEKIPITTQSTSKGNLNTTNSQTMQSHLKKQRSIASNSNNRSGFLYGTSAPPNQVSTSMRSIPTITIIREEIPPHLQQLKAPSTRKILSNINMSRETIGQQQESHPQKNQYNREVQNQQINSKIINSRTVDKVDLTKLSNVSLNNNQRQVNSISVSDTRGLDESSNDVLNQPYFIRSGIPTNKSTAQIRQLYINGGRNVDRNRRTIGSNFSYSGNNGKSYELSEPTVGQVTTTAFAGAGNSSHNASATNLNLGGLRSKKLHTQSSSQFDKIIGSVTNTSGQKNILLDPLIEFYKKKVEIKKDFGQRVSTADRIALKCKGKTNSFFNDLICFQESNNSDTTQVKSSMKLGFNRISQDFERWNNGFLDSNENFEIALAQEVIHSVKHDGAFAFTTN